MANRRPSSKQQQPKKSLKRFQALLGKGIALCDQGDELASDKLLEAVLAAPSVWAKHRFYALLKALWMKQENKGRLATKRDTKLVSRQFVYDESEPAHFRCAAILFIARVKHFYGHADVNSAAELIRLGLDIIDQSPKKDEDRFVLYHPHYYNEDFRKDPSLKSILRFQKEFLLMQLENFAGNALTNEEKHALTVVGQRDAAKDPGTRSHSNDPEIALLTERSYAGGNMCDCCRKTMKEFQVESLLRCSRCLMVYYCSAKCQKEDWKARHKHECREEGQIKPGDDMVLMSSFQFVNVIGPAEGATNHWLVQFYGSDKQDSVCGDVLTRLRPASVCSQRSAA